MQLKRIELQLLDDVDSQWACESIEIQDLNTADTFMYMSSDSFELESNRVVHSICLHV
jgi:hypothetical protein